MTMAVRRSSPLPLGSALLAGLLLAAPRHADALNLDDRGEMRLGMRAYTAVRVGTERMGGDDNPLTFPDSPAGHVRQHRYFLELKLDHNVTRLATTGHGLGRLFGWLDPTKLRYSLQYRGEGEGIYDYGPSEFQHGFRTTAAFKQDLPDLDLSAIGGPNLSPDLPEEFVRRRVDRIRRVARQRHRLFLAYLDVERGPVFVRVGRQILAWGETDVFRLLDNINPLDDGFGGFLIALDERRIPLDMVRASYHFTSIGPLADAFFEAFGGLGNRVATIPGIPNGSPWMPAGLGAPNKALARPAERPDKEDFRGGFRFVFNHRDVTYSLAHYWTYLDVPGVTFRLPVGFAGFNNEIVALQRMPRTPITGASATFPVPSWYAVVRSEVAYFHNEPLNRQGRGDSADAAFPPGTPQYRRLLREHNTEGGLNPFVYPGFLDTTRTTPFQGTMLQRDSFNMALGLDVNRFIRRLNPGQTFFFTTQFFYKHVFDSPGDLVLPVPSHNIPVADSLLAVGKDAPLSGCPGPRGTKRSCRLQPRLLAIPDDQFLHTFLVSTSYRGGKVVPSFAMFYDWAGAFLFQPGVTLVRDPFRFVFDYTRINAGIGTGRLAALRDRDNVRFQVEYVF
jgi:hypothetical protein